MIFIFVCFKHCEEYSINGNDFNKSYDDALTYFDDGSVGIATQGLDSLALTNAQMNLQTAYNNFFRSPKAGFPKFKSKKSSRRSYTTNCVNGNIFIREGYIKLPKVGLVKLKQHRTIPSDYKLKFVTVSQTPSGKYYASVLFEYENQVQEQAPQTFIGFFHAWTV